MTAIAELSGSHATDAPFRFYPFNDDGTLALTRDGQHYLTTHNPDILNKQLHQYMQAALLGKCATPYRRLIGRGDNAEVYALTPKSDIVVKEIDLNTTPFDDIFYPLAHMNELAEVIDAQQTYVKVPQHYGLLTSQTFDRAFLFLERVKGLRMFEVLHKQESLPPQYRACVERIISTYCKVQSHTKEICEENHLCFDEVMEDWGPHNILVSLNKSKVPTFWIIDQALHRS